MHVAHLCAEGPSEDCDHEGGEALLTSLAAVCGEFAAFKIIGFAMILAWSVVRRRAVASSPNRSSADQGNELDERGGCADFIRNGMNCDAQDSSRPCEMFS